MRIALLADIHANLHALKAVLKDIAPTGADALVSLGDVVGYGANPAECVDLLRKLGCRGVMGNHDYYVSKDGPGIERILSEGETATNPVWAGVRHAREQLDDDQLAWLRAQEPVGGIGEDLVAHAALHDFAQWPYLRSLREARPTLELLNGRIGFFGHTHCEDMFFEEEIDNRAQPTPERLAEDRYRLPINTSIAITAGATGQPRDGDPQARWLSWDTETRTLEFHRVAYDNQAAAEAILAAGLPERSARRLLG